MFDYQEDTPKFVVFTDQTAAVRTQALERNQEIKQVRQRSTDWWYTYPSEK